MRLVALAGVDRAPVRLHRVDMVNQRLVENRVLVAAIFGIVGGDKLGHAKDGRGGGARRIGRLLQSLRDSQHARGGQNQEGGAHSNFSVGLLIQQKRAV